MEFLSLQSIIVSNHVLALFWFKIRQGLSGGTMGTNPPASVKDTGWITGPGKVHMPLSPGATLLSLHDATTEACGPRTCAPQQEASPSEKPVHWETKTPHT